MKKFFTLLQKGRTILKWAGFALAFFKAAEVFFDELDKLDTSKEIEAKDS